MLPTAILSGLLICLVLMEISFHIRQITEKGYMPPNAILLIDAWNLSKVDSRSGERIAITS